MADDKRTTPDTPLEQESTDLSGPVIEALEMISVLRRELGTFSLSADNKLLFPRDGELASEDVTRLKRLAPAITSLVVQFPWLMDTRGQGRYLVACEDDSAAQELVYDAFHALQGAAGELPWIKDHYLGLDYIENLIDVTRTHWIQERYVPYGTYLKSAHWKAQRQQAIERARGRCQLCNKAQNLNVHHRTYERIGDELPEDLIVLCRDCHAKFHGKLP